MRASFIIAAILVAVLMLGFAMNNLGTSVPVTLLTETAEYRLWLVVLASVVLGAAIMGFLGLIDGARTRLENLRMRREIHKLETELNFLRTQPSSGPAYDEPPEPLNDDPPPKRLPEAARTAVDRPNPSAPVYETEERGIVDAGIDDDDDAYSGGRAV